MSYPMIEGYQANQWYLVPLHLNSKRPVIKDWNQLQNCIAPTMTPPEGYQFGLAHAYSGTCAIDVDMVIQAGEILLSHGINLTGLMATDLQISSGRADHGKLIYAMPAGVTLPTKVITAPVNINGKTVRCHALQFRCATAAGHTAQDVLPPSIHPDTGQPYQWLNSGTGLKEIPQALLKVWTDIITQDDTLRPAGEIQASIAEIESALAFINPDIEYGEWLRIGMAIHHFDPNAFDVFDNWSARGVKYSGHDGINGALTKWNSFSSNSSNPVTVLSVYRQALDNNWPGYQRPASEIFNDLTLAGTNDLIESLQRRLCALKVSDRAEVTSIIREAVRGGMTVELAITSAIIERRLCSAGDIQKLIADAKVPKRKLSYMRLSDVVEAPLCWLWEGFLIDRKINLIAGDPGVSKSLLIVELGAMISNGGEWPDGTPCPQGNVIILNAEDAANDTLKPRFIAAGANMDNIYIVNGSVDAESADDEKLFSLENDTELLREMIDEIGNVRMVSIDPVNAYLGTNTNTNKDTEIRAVLTPLGVMASEKAVCVICNTHLNKDMNKDAIYRVIGSVGMVGAPRIVWGVTKDKEDPERRLITNIKANITKDGEGLAYRIGVKDVYFENEGITQPNPVVEFEKERHGMTAQDVMVTDAGRDAPARGAAAAVIEELLQAGPVKSADLIKACTEENHSKDAIKRARGALKVRALQKMDTRVWWSAAAKDAVILENYSGEQLEEEYGIAQLGTPTVPAFLL